MAIKNNNAIIVKRVSGVDQMQGTSLDSQEEMARTVAEHLEAKVIAVYDEGAISGSLYMARDVLQEAIARIEMGDAKYLIFGQFDRSARSVANLELMYRRIVAAGGEIHHADLAFEKSDEGVLIRQQMASLKEYERSVIAIRTKRGRRTRAQQGSMPHRYHAPYGYYIIKKGDVEAGHYKKGMVGRYVIVEDVAKNVRDIFEMFVLEGKNYNEIATTLTDRGIPTPQNGADWKAETIKVILRNSAYRGRAQFGKTKRVWDESRKVERGLKTIYYNAPSAPDEIIDIPCPPVITDELWLAAQVRMQDVSSKHSEVKGHRNHSNSILAGILRCPECDAGMNRFGKTNRDGRRYYYYRCPYGAGMRKTVTSRSCTHKTTYSMPSLDNQVIEIVNDMASNPQRIYDAVIAYERELLQSGGEAAKRQALKTELDTLAKKEYACARKQVEAEMNGHNTQVYDDLLAEINKQREALLKQIDVLPSDELPISLTRDRQEQFTAQLQIVQEVLSASDVKLNVKRDMLSKVVERVDILPNKKAQVTFRARTAAGARGIPICKRD